MKYNDLTNLKGLNAVVTGGTGYLGNSICEVLLEAGATVVAVSRGESPNFNEEIFKSSNFKTYKYDLSSKEGVNQFFNAIDEEYNTLDILVNNSYTWPQKVHFLDQDWDDFKKTINIGLISQIYLTKLVFKKMINKNNGGSIINISSMYGKVSPDFAIYRDSGMGNAIDYGITKAGMLQFTKYLASIGGKYNIRSNSISPGPFPRPGALDGKEWFEDELNKKNMLCRVGKPEELKGAVLLLSSELGSYITGEDIAVDGGWTAW